MQYFLTMTVLLDGRPAMAMQVSLFSGGSEDCSGSSLALPCCATKMPPQTDAHSESSTMAMMFIGV